MNKLLQLITILGFVSSTAYAQTNNSQLKISANIQPGCLISASNYNFGEVTAKNLLAATNFNTSPLAVTNNLSFSCSKDIIITLSQSGLINASRSGSSSNLLSLNGTGVFKVNDVINYKFLTSNIISNEDVSITNRPLSERLGSKNADGDFTLSMKVLKGGQFNIPLTAALMNSYGYLQSLGNYSDTTTFTLTF